MSTSPDNASTGDVGLQPHPRSPESWSSDEPPPAYTPMHPLRLHPLPGNLQGLVAASPASTTTEEWDVQSVFRHSLATAIIDPTCTGEEQGVNDMRHFWISEFDKMDVLKEADVREWKVSS